ncbi:MAG TPA: Rieske 2Fe-2S domain-containing protein [Nitrosopumilaceae archaeon]|nr:Rieske 2Fe-2S domain-containing protein [Nitrosopumilaceae archaeon]
MAGKISDIPPGEMLKVESEEKEILVANENGNYFAMDDTCTHQGANLSKGTLDGSIVTCPWHGSTWNCKTGKLIAFASQIEDYELQLDDYELQLESQNENINSLVEIVCEDSPDKEICLEN